MKTQSAKAKGRKLQQWVRDKLLYEFDLDEGEVISTSMGAGGMDIQLSPKARTLIPLAIECKAHHKFAVYSMYEQAISNSKNLEPVVIIKGDRKKPLALVDAEYLFALLHKSNYSGIA